mgnify:CR=1 FL=1|jgi:hypothetical protein
MSSIQDTVQGIRPGVIREPHNANFTDMVQLVWIKNTGEQHKAIFPRRTATEMLATHLNPQKEQGLLSLAEIRELEPLGTN